MTRIMIDTLLQSRKPLARPSPIAPIVFTSDPLRGTGPRACGQRGMPRASAEASGDLRATAGSVLLPAATSPSTEAPA